MARHLSPYRGFGFSPVLSLYRDINRLFDDAFQGDLSRDTAGQSSRFIDARMNVSETENAFKLTVELPGVAEEDINISLDDDILTVRGEKRIEKSEEKENFHAIERTFGEFQRSLRLPFATDPERVEARFENGLLTVTIPKSEKQERSRRIPLQGGQSAAKPSIDAGAPEAQENQESGADET